MTAALASAAVLAVAAGLLALVVFALRRGKWRELLAAAVSVLIAFAAAEVALRRLRPYESLCRFRWLASERYHHVNPPSRTMFTGYVDGVPVVVRTNADGFRSEHSRDGFLRHRTRIAVLGDSFVFGPGVAAEQAVAHRLQARLRERASTRDAAVLNAGVISHSPLLEARLFEGVVAAYRPTAVLLFLDVTDVGDDAIYSAKLARGGGRFALEGSTSLGCHGAVHQLAQPCLSWVGARLAYPLTAVRRAWGRPPPPAANYYLDPVIFQGREENRYFIYRHPLEQTRPFFEATLGHVRGVAAAARRAGAAFALVIVPRYHHWSARECPDNWERGTYHENEPFQYEYFRFFAEARATSDFPMVDLLPAFRATREFPLVFRHDPHWNARGHDFVARVVAADLVARGLVP